HGEDDADAEILQQPSPDRGERAEQQHIDESGDDRRDRERQVDQRDQEGPAGKAVFGDGPGRRDAEDEVAGNGDGGDEQRQQDRRYRFAILEGGERLAEAEAERLHEDRDQRHEQEQRQQRDGE